jgi:hypothetical protein
VSAEVSEEHIAFNFRVEKISWARNQRESRWKSAVSCSVYFFDPEDGGDMFLRNVG